MLIRRGVAVVGLVLLWAGDRSEAAAPPAGEADIPRLVKELGDDNFLVRERAGDRLRDIGLPARPALLAAAAGRDPEVVNRARALLETISWTVKDDVEEIQSLLSGYNRAQPVTRRGLVIQIVRKGERLGWDKTLPALLRLVRYEDNEDVRREVLSTLVAWDLPEVRAVMEKLVPAQPTSAADWALRALLERDRPAEAAASLERAVKAERERLQRFPGLPRRMLALLLQRRSAALAGAGREAEATAELAEAAALDPADRDLLLHLLERQLDQRDWAGLLEKSARTHALRIAGDARALFVVGRAHHLGNHSEEAEKSFKAARELVAGDELSRFALLDFLTSRGWDEAAETECKSYLDSSASGDLLDVRVNAWDRLAGVQARRGRLDEAAKSLERAVKLLEDRLKSGAGGTYYFKTVGSPEGLRARWLAMQLAAAQAKKDAAAVSKLVTQLKQYAQYDADATFALHTALVQMKETGSAALAVKWARTHHRLTFQRDPDPAHASALAWLLAKTGQELDEAAELAEQAVRRAPERASSWDTLAEVRFRRGEAERAVSAARRALELEPFDIAYRAQWKRFGGAK